MKPLAIALYFALWFFGCAQPAKPRGCIIEIADAQMRALVQGALLCHEETACIEREIEQRVLILSEYVEVCVDEENH